LKLEAAEVWRAVQRGAPGLRQARTYPRPILVGYIHGAALIIIGSQLARFFGLERKAGNFADLVERSYRVPLSRAASSRGR
jgi:hypothetical protein